MMQKLIKETMTGKKQKGMRIDSSNFMLLEKCLKEKKMTPRDHMLAGNQYPKKHNCALNFLITRTVGKEFLKKGRF